MVILSHVTHAEELYLSHTTTIHAAYVFAPVREGDLNVLVALDVYEVAVLVAVSQPQISLTNTGVGKPRELGIDAIGEALVCDVEGRHEGDVVAAIAVDLDLELGLEGRVIRVGACQGVRGGRGAGGI